MSRTQLETFVEKLCGVFWSLEGREIVSAAGVEMALRDDDDGRPLFESDDVPCVQMLVLYLTFAKGPILKVVTHAEWGTWGLWPSASDEDWEQDQWDGIYRWRQVTEVTLGVVTKVQVCLSEQGLVEAVLVSLGQRQFVLVAGEVYEEQGGLELVRGDESVLVFPNVQSISAARWRRILL